MRFKQTNTGSQTNPQVGSPLGRVVDYIILNKTDTCRKICCQHMGGPQNFLILNPIGLAHHLLLPVVAP